MDNRRQDYRHVFRPHEHRAVRLSRATETAGALRGEVVDLSLGGMRVRLQGALPLQPNERCRVQLDIESDQALQFDAQVVHAATAPDSNCGLRFLPLVEMNASEARERRLWKFLLDEQRRWRRARAE